MRVSGATHTKASTKKENERERERERNSTPTTLRPDASHCSASRKNVQKKKSKKKLENVFSGWKIGTPKSFHRVQYPAKEIVWLLFSLPPPYLAFWWRCRCCCCCCFCCCWWCCWCCCCGSTIFLVTENGSGRRTTAIGRVASRLKTLYMQMRTCFFFKLFLLPKREKKRIEKRREQQNLTTVVAFVVVGVVDVVVVVVVVPWSMRAFWLAGTIDYSGGFNAFQSGNPTEKGQQVETASVLAFFFCFCSFLFFSFYQ